MSFKNKMIEVNDPEVNTTKYITVIQMYNNITLIGHSESEDSILRLPTSINSTKQRSVKNSTATYDDIKGMLTRGAIETLYKTIGLNAKLIF